MQENCANTLSLALAGSSQQDREDSDAIARLLRRPALREYTCYHALNSARRHSSAVLVREGCRPSRIVRGLGIDASDAGGSKPAPHPEGRVLLLRFDELDVLATYSPNCGWRDDSRARRCEWDATVGAFLDRRTEARRRWRDSQVRRGLKPQDGV